MSDNTKDFPKDWSGTWDSDQGDASMRTFRRRYCCCWFQWFKYFSDAINFAFPFLLFKIIFFPKSHPNIAYIRSFSLSFPFSLGVTRPMRLRFRSLQMYSCSCCYRRKGKGRACPFNGPGLGGVGGGGWEIFSDIEMWQRDSFSV